jgi:predicted helicase
MRHMSQDNLALVCLRQVKGESWAHAFVAKNITNKFTLSSKSSNVSYHFPLFLLNDDSKSGALFERGTSDQVNLSAEVINQFSAIGGMSKSSVRDNARQVFFYIYAVLYSPAYRLRYSEYLCLAFPRVPLPGSPALFRDLSRRGEELVALHLLDTSTIDQFVTAYTGPDNPEISRVAWAADTVWLDAPASKKGYPSAGTIGFSGVPEEVWKLHIGGYQICEKWLKDRKGYSLSMDDIAYYQKIVAALAATIRSMSEIDEVIKGHGGWPGAFKTGPAQLAGGTESR